MLNFAYVAAGCPTRNTVTNMKVLFLSSAGSARGHIAQALLHSVARQQGEEVEAYSANEQPLGTLCTEQLDTASRGWLEEAGIDASAVTPPPLDSLLEMHFDYLIWLGDESEQASRHWPSAGVTLCWDHSEPTPTTAAQCLGELRERVELFLKVNSKHHTARADTLTPVELFKALADDTRLLSLLLIAQEGELCVCELMNALSEPQPKISRHLAQLRKRGILQDRRQGQWVYYKLHPNLPQWVHGVLSLTLENNAAYLNESRQRLSASC